MTMHYQPIASIIVPMRNAGAYVKDCLASLLTQAQYVEIIVVNDRSSDNSLAVASSFLDSRIKIVDGPGTGISDCMNVGARHACGAYIMRCDADDLYPPGRLRRQVDFLEKNHEFGAICGGFSSIDTKGRLVADMMCGDEAVEITDDLRAGKTRTHLCTFAIRATEFASVGGFRSYFTSGEDIDFQLRLGEKTRVFYDPADCYSYRIHNASITHTQKSVERIFFERISSSFQEQRRSGALDDLDAGFPPSVPSNASLPSSASSHLQGLLLGRAWQAHAHGDFRQAITSGFRAVIADPSSLTTWKSFSALVVKRPSKSLKS
jgi:glycosyltransferase involved in cell wall biosynthesis